MKTVLLVITMLFSHSIFAQEQELDIQISAQGSSITAFINKDNNENVLKLNHKKDGKLFFVYSKAKNEPTLNRRYFLVNSKDEEIPLSIISRIIGTYNVPLIDVFSKTKVGEKYRLFTMATPKDPQQAAATKVRRFLLTNVEIL